MARWVSGPPKDATGDLRALGTRCRNTGPKRKGSNGKVRGKRRTQEGGVGLGKKGQAPRTQGRKSFHKSKPTRGRGLKI